MDARLVLEVLVNVFPSHFKHSHLASFVNGKVYLELLLDPPPAFPVTVFLVHLPKILSE